MVNETEEFVEGKVTVAFKPGSDASAIEKMLKNYPHEKLFPEIKYDPNTPELTQSLALTYSLKVLFEERDGVVSQLRQEKIVDYVEKVGTRRLIV